MLFTKKTDCPSYYSVMVQNVAIGSRRKAKDHLKTLAEGGKRVSLSTVKDILYEYRLKSHSEKKNVTIGNLKLPNALREKALNFNRHVLSHCEKGGAYEPGNPIQTVEHKGGSLWQEGLLNFTI